MKWGSWVLANITFKNLVFTCTDSQKNAIGECNYSTGNEVLDLYNFNGNKNDLNFHIIILFIVILMFFLVSVLVFRIKAYQISH
jgi:hypothetical protein